MSNTIAAALPALNLSQPADSRQVQAPEAEPQVRMFHGSKFGVELAAAGEDFVRRSRALLAEAETLLACGRASKAGR